MDKRAIFTFLHSYKCIERAVRRYIDFYCSLGCDVILTSVWGAGVGRRMAGISRV